MKYGLSEKQLEEIVDFIAQYPEVETAVLFGSRALGTYKEASDVDIALHGEKVNHSLAAKMKFNIEEDTYLPFMFDFVAYPTITNDALRKHIDTKGVVIFRRGGSEWKEGTLADVAEVVMGQSPLGETCNSVGEGVPLLNGPTEFGNRYPTPVQFTVDPKKFSKIDDILFCVRGSTTGRMNWSNQRYALGRGLAAIRHNKGREYRYFTRGVLDFNLPILLASATGSTFPNVSRDQLTKLELLIPPLPEQKAIASLLSTLDDKIDLLHRQNKTLEAMAETLFRQWFVEEAQEDWEEGTVADLIEFNPTRKLPKGKVAPYLEMAALSTTTFSPDGWYDREFTSGTKFISGDTLLARITPCLENGKAAFVMFIEPGEVGWGSTEYIVMRPKELLHPFFAYTLSRNRDFRDYAESCMEKSIGWQRVNVDHLKNYEMKIPSLEAVNEFNAFAESTVQKLRMNSNQIRTLEKLRDTLLPKLMSGEVRVAV